MKVRFNIVKVIISFSVVVLAVAFAMPRSQRFSYEYKIGYEWEYEDFYSDLSFPLLKSSEQLRDEILSGQPSPIPYFRYDEDVTNNALRSAASANLSEMTQAVLASLQKIMEKGVVADDQALPSDETGIVYIQKNKRAQKSPSAELWTQSRARSRLLADIMAAGCANADSLLRSSKIYDLIVPNLVYDKQTTELVNSASGNISPTSGYVSNGTLLVRHGEIVTPETAQTLDSYKAEKQSRGYLDSGALVFLGNLILSIALAVLLYFAIYYTNPTVFTDSRFYHVLTVFLLTAVGTLLAVRQGSRVFLYVPYTLAALYLQAFFKETLIVPVYSVCLLPLMLFAGNGACYYLMYLVAGIAATCAIKHFAKGWMQFIVAIITFAVLSVVYAALLALHFMESGEWSYVLVRLLAASLLTVAGYPLIYLFEKMFNLVSNSRLRELCDTSNSLLRQLEQKAPGTFQHSLQVMNMADAAARAIDANPLLVRAGALYHDIGKMRNPQCFVENESLLSKNEADKYHFGLTPEQSAHDIIKHVIDGEELARKERLPGIIIDFIRTHHGTSTVSYFYNKALNSGSEVDIEQFRYPGVKPATREQVILMLCDTIEAASRSLQTHTPESCAAFVDKIVKGKLEEGQLDASEISIKELEELKEALKTYLLQMHHERIAYPENRNKKQIKKNYERRTEKN